MPPDVATTRPWDDRGNRPDHLVPHGISRLAATNPPDYAPVPGSASSALPAPGVPMAGAEAADTQATGERVATPAVVVAADRPAVASRCPNCPRQQVRRRTWACFRSEWSAVGAPFRPGNLGTGPSQVRK